MSLSMNLMCFARTPKSNSKITGYPYFMRDFKTTTKKGVVIINGITKYNYGIALALYGITILRWGNMRDIK